MKIRGRFQALSTLWSIRDFRSLCGSQVLAGLGEWLATMALIALMWERTHSALFSGLVLVLRILPAAVLGSFLGSLVDRFNGRSVLLWATAGRAAVYGALPFVGGIGAILALALVAEVATIAYMSARDATLPRLVPESSLPAANALSMGSAYGAMPVGSALYALFALLGSGAVEAGLASAGALLAVATLMVGRINAKATACERGDACVNVSWRDGFRALRIVFRTDAVLRKVAIGGAAAAMGGGVVITLGMSYVRSTLHATSASFGLLIASFCAGVVVGVVSLQKLRLHLAKIFMAGIAAMGAILLMMALLPSTPVGFAMGFVFGASFVVVFLGGITILQERVEDSLRGRAFALAHSSLRVAAVVVGVLAAWGAKALGEGTRQLGVFRLDGNQAMMFLAGALLTVVAVMMLRTGAVQAAEHS